MTREAWMIPVLELLGYTLAFQRTAPVTTPRKRQVSDRVGAAASSGLGETSGRGG